jgi:transcriptional regulator with XRE-family HTH domain
MPRGPPRPWLAEDEERKNRILAAARARGMTQTELAAVAGLGSANAGKLRVSAWKHGRTHLTEEQLAAMESALERQPAAVAATGSAEADAALGAPGDVRGGIRELEKLVGRVPKGEKDALRWLAGRLRRAALGTLAQAMVSARSWAVRVQAGQAILAYSDGKPTQREVPDDREPPAQDNLLLQKLERLMAGLPAAAGAEVAGERRDAGNAGTAAQPDRTPAVVGPHATPAA